MSYGFVSLRGDDRKKVTAVQDRIEGHLPMVKTGALHQPGRDFQGEVCGFEL
jgi:hypothetical protein